VTTEYVFTREQVNRIGLTFLERLKKGDGVSAVATVSVGEPKGVSECVSVTVTCSACDYKVWTGGRAGYDWSRLIDDHLFQHNSPGRALDIEVDWEPSARCSVCPDGIGDIRHSDQDLECWDCGTTWNLDGTAGYRTEG